MLTICEIFGGLEGSLLVICLGTLVWGYFRHWELEMIIPMIIALYGTAFLAAGFLLAVVFHDHIHVHLHVN